AGADVEADLVERAQDAPAGRELHHQIAQRQDRSRAHRSRGFSASRSQSPRRLTDSASASSVSDGKSRIHHSPENRNACPKRISVPRLGCVGGTPTPRNDSVASAMIASASEIVAITRIGSVTFGST